MDGLICSKCSIQSWDVHECMNCDIQLCVDCDENEMPTGADDHTYCTPCVSKLFTDADYEEVYECSEECLFDENYTKEQYDKEFEKVNGYGYYTDWLGEPYEDWVLLVKE